MIDILWVAPMNNVWEPFAECGWDSDISFVVVEDGDAWSSDNKGTMRRLR